jgi:hypothetical protein
MSTSGNGSTRDNGQVAPADRVVQAVANAAAFPRPGTAEWGQMNRRRAELIRKNLGGELTEEEREEYERLQRLSLAALEAAFPRDDGSQTEGEGPEAKGA